MSSKVKLFTTLGGKMGLSSENIIRKGVELHRLLQLKTQISNIKISETCQIVLCLDLAASSLGIPFEKVDAVKISGFGVSEASSTAEKILTAYKNSEPSGRAIEFDHPMYCVAAVLTACKKCKLKIDRAKLMDMSSIKKSAFLKLLSSFEKISENIVAKPIKRKRVSDEDSDMPLKEMSEKFMKPTLPEPSAEPEVYSKKDYEEWKRKILEECETDD
ncbi:hypothetical protein L9F63_004022 [Diploptera punctata]|uniref:ORC6 second cyclin-like domain-containing protein n=1 Tax=Diploptera punctata TaxID=6984 RepID=A0AAD7ZH47_DIPPU|nr:hypothetical protein L9F63_004022 [Diploptera punctata]